MDSIVIKSGDFKIADKMFNNIWNIRIYKLRTNYEKRGMYPYRYWVISDKDTFSTDWYFKSDIGFVGIHCDLTNGNSEILDLHKYNLVKSD